MKKIMSFTLVLLLVVSCAVLPSCKKKTPYELVSEAIANTTTYSSYEVTMTMDMEMSVMGMKVETDMVQDMAASGLDGDSPVIKATQKANAVGQSTEVGIYFKEGVYYISVLGQKVKVDQDAIAESELADYNLADDADDFSDIIVALPETVFKEDTVIVENSDGTKSVELTLTADEFKEIYSEFVKAISEVSDVSTVKTSDAKIKVTVDGDKVCAIDMKVDLNMTVEGMETSIKLDVAVKNINGDVKIDAPADLDSYTNLDSLG